MSEEKSIEQSPSDDNKLFRPTSKDDTKDADVKVKDTARNAVDTTDDGKYARKGQSHRKLEPRHVHLLAIGRLCFFRIACRSKPPSFTYFFPQVELLELPVCFLISLFSDRIVGVSKSKFSTVFIGIGSGLTAGGPASLFLGKYILFCVFLSLYADSLPSLFVLVKCYSLC